MIYLLYVSKIIYIYFTMKLITKPCQGGKTFINIEEIKGNIQDINIVLNRYIFIR